MLQRSIIFIAIYNNYAHRDFKLRRSEIYGLKYAAPLELYVNENKLCYKYYAPPELSQQIKL